nr:hypothetical protein [Tanacetum cinerariifolium]
QRIGELEQHMANLLQYNLALEERLDKNGSWLYNLENLNIPHLVSKAVDEIFTDAVDWAMYNCLTMKTPKMITCPMQIREKTSGNHCLQKKDQLGVFVVWQQRKQSCIINFQDEATRYPDFGLELLVPEQMWNDDVHDSPSRRKEIRTHMRILSVIRIKAYSRYGYDYLSEIILQRADFQEHMIAEKDFKNLYPTDFEDLNLLLLQDHAVQQNIQVSDGTWTRILEALDYRVKEFKVKQLNPGMNTRFWTQKDMTRSKGFIAAIKRRLKTRRIYRNLECFISGRVRD